MAKLITAVEKIARAKELITQARDLPVPETTGWQDFSYVARVKDLMRQAKDLIKFIPLTAGADPDLKQEAKALLILIDNEEKAILHKGSEK